MYNVVTNANVLGKIKLSKYFKIDLGSRSTIDTNDGRKFNIEKEGFVQDYYIKYKALIQKSGSIGSIEFYTDHTIKEDLIIFFRDDKSWLFNHDESLLESKGIDSYMGMFIKGIEEPSSKLVSGTTNTQTETYDNPVISSPYNATYDDLQNYIREKKPRF